MVSSDHPRLLCLHWVLSPGVLLPVHPHLSGLPTYPTGLPVPAWHPTDGRWGLLVPKALSLSLYAGQFLAFPLGLWETWTCRHIRGPCPTAAYDLR